MIVPLINGTCLVHNYIMDKLYTKCRQFVVVIGVKLD